MGFGLDRNSSPLLTAIGVAVALVAVVGTQFLGWEWGSGQLTPAIIGAAAAAIAIVAALNRRR